LKAETVGENQRRERAEVLCSPPLKEVACGFNDAGLIRQDCV